MVPRNPEFSLHVHKKTAIHGGCDLYTIGLWNGPTLYAICHVQPLDHALSALRSVLDQAGRPESSVLPFQQNEAGHHKEGTSLRRLAAAMLASLASVIKPLR